jgi:FAD/FMN-containing dehydrogenase
MSTILGNGTLQELRDAVHGGVVTPADPDYERARAVWNGMIDRRPAVIVRCSGVADVVAAVEFGRSQGLEVAVRGGGHGLPGFGTCDEGLVIDLSPMKGIRVDPKEMRVSAQGGVTWGELDHETQAFGLATTGGLVSTTGVAGFTLGGGVGWLMRTYGLACDNLVAADLVTAQGRVVRVNESENSELLRGLRGGGGNFGVVTQLEFRLHRVGPEVLAGPIFFPGDQADAILKGWRDWSASVPDELSTLVSLATAPPVPFLPQEWHGRKVVILVGAWAGSVGDGQEVVAPLRKLGAPIVDLLGPMPYLGLQSLVDPLWGPGARNYFSSAYLSDLPPAAIEALTTFHQACPSPSSEIHVHQMGGAVARVPSSSSTFANREAPWLLNVVGRWTDADADAENLHWARSLRDEMARFGNGGAYANFLGVGDDRVKQAYPPDTYRFLANLKSAWDPTNLFRLNQNVAPAPEER